MKRSFHLFFWLAFLAPLGAVAQLYDVTWTHLTAAEVTGSTTLQSLNGNGWNSGALSSQVLWGGSTGYLEFSLTDVGTRRVVGFEEYPVTNARGRSQDWGIEIRENGDVYALVSGAYTFLQSIAGGSATVRVERTASDMLFKVSGVTLHTEVLGAAVNQNLLVHATIYSVGGALSGVQTSYSTTLPTMTFDVTDLAGPSSGAIDVTVTGGLGPHSFAWSTSATTEDITGLSAGQYTLTLTDNGGHALTYEVSVGHDLVWDRSRGAIISGDTLTREYTSGGWTTGGATANVLWGGTSGAGDGWVEMILPAQDYNYYIGFDVPPFSHVYQTTIDYGFKVNTDGRIQRRELGALYGFGTYDKGDIVRIERIGTSLEYSMNGQVLHTSTVSETDDWQLRVVMHTASGVVSNVRWSNGEQRTKVAMDVTNVAADGSSLGGIDVTVSAGLLPYSFAWSNGASTEDIAGLAKGNYTVTVTDADGNTVESTVGVGYDVVWTQLVDAEVNGTDLINNVNSSGWNSGAVSSQVLSGDFWVEHTITLEQTRNLNLAVPPVAASNVYNTAPYGIATNGTRLFQSRELGAAFTQGTYMPGDVVRMERSGTTITYSLNNMVVRTITGVSAAQDYVVQATLANYLDKWDGIRCSGNVDLVASAIVTDATDTQNGSFSLDIQGGDPPYLLIWNGDGGAVTETEFNGLMAEVGSAVTPPTFTEFLDQLYQDTYTDVPSGDYDLKVVGRSGSEQTLTVTVNDVPVWDEQVGVAVSGNDFTKTASNGWDNAYVTARNIIKDGADGRLTFELSSLSQEAAAGFRILDQARVSGYQDLTYGFVVESGSIKVWEGGSLSSQLATYALGDKLSIEREGTTLTFRHNATALRTLTVSVNETLQPEFIQKTVDTWITKTGMTEVPARPTYDHTVTHADCRIGNNGAVTITNLNSSFGPENFTWKDDAGSVVSTTQSLTNVPGGTYSLTISNQAGTISYTYYFQIGFEVEWTSPTGNAAVVVGEENSLYTTGANPGLWDNSGESVNYLKDGQNGWVEYDIEQFDNSHANYQVQTGWKPRNGSNPEGIARIVAYPSAAGGNGISWHLFAAIGMNSSGTPIVNGFGWGHLQQAKVQKLSNDVHFRIKSSNYPGSIGLPSMLFQIGSPAQNTDLMVRGGMNHLNNEIARTIVSFGCTEPPFAILKKQVEGTFYKVQSGMLAFKYDEDYFRGSGDNLEYHIYDDSQNEVTLDPQYVNKPVVYGDNRFVVHVDRHPNLTLGFYTLEVVNDNNEKWYLRFKI
ncbi:MAG: SprB repeat-containing protein [Bacteroidota bacterium]